MLRNRQVFEDGGFRPKPADPDDGGDGDSDDDCGPFLLSLLSAEEEQGEPTDGKVSAAIAQGVGQGGRRHSKLPKQTTTNSSQSTQHTHSLPICRDVSLPRTTLWGTNSKSVEVEGRLCGFQNPFNRHRLSIYVAICVCMIRINHE